MCWYLWTYQLPMRQPASAWLASVSRACLTPRPESARTLAIRLEQAGVSTARFWMSLQSNYELAQALARPQPPVMPLRTSSTPE